MVKKDQVVVYIGGSLLGAWIILLTVLFQWNYFQCPKLISTQLFQYLCSSFLV